MKTENDLSLKESYNILSSCLIKCKNTFLNLKYYYSWYDHSLCHRKITFPK